MREWLHAYVELPSDAVAVWMTPSSLRRCESASRTLRPDFRPVGAVRAKCRYVAARAWLRANVQQLSEVRRCG